MKLKHLKNILIIPMLIIIYFILFNQKVNSFSNYVITTKQDFIDYLLSENSDMEASYILTSDLDFSTGTVTYQGITYNLNKSGLTISPIGEKKDENGKYRPSNYNPFKGTFNGSGYVIKGLHIRSLAEENEYVGLFGYNEGIISNLGIVDSTIDGSVHVGAIAGYNMGSIVGCYNTSTVTGVGTVGGITGINYGYIRNCYNTGYVGGATKVGGIVGQNSFVITAVYDLGIISGDETEDGRKEYGYIFGYNNAQGVIGYVEDETGGNSFINPYQKYSIAGAYYSLEYDIGVGYNVGYLSDGVIKHDNVNVYGKTLSELKDINTYDNGFKNARSNIKPIESSYTHKTTGFFIKSGGSYRFPVVGTSEFTTKEHVENSLHNNGFEGSGTIYNPYIIKDEVGLTEIKHSLTSAYFLNNNITLSNNFIPIGNDNNYFKGIFNGNGKRISNLSIESTDELEYVGLFAFNSGIIHNISVNANINVPNATKIGAIAGFNNGQIYESYVIGNVNGQRTVGGLVGANEKGIIKDSYNKANISGNQDIGGIAGFNSGRIENVYSVGQPTSQDFSLSSNLGSIVGYNENSIYKNNVYRALYEGDNQIGYQSSNNNSYSNLENKVDNKSEFGKIEEFSGFSIQKIASGNTANTTWTIEPGVNDNMAFLTRTPLIRITNIDLDKSKNIIEDGSIINVFDNDGNMIIGTPLSSYGKQIDLLDFIILKPFDAENQNIYFEIITGASHISIDNTIISGISSGNVLLRVITEDGSKTLDINLIIRDRVEDIYFADSEENELINEIEVENFSEFYLFAKTRPNNVDYQNITWDISENDFLINKGDNLFLINYNNLENKIIAGKYQNEVKVFITITSIDNNSIQKQLIIKVIPSSKKIDRNTIKLYDKGILLNLEYIDNKYKLSNSQMVSFDSDYINIVLNNNYKQEFTLSSTRIFIEEINSLESKLFLSKGDIENNSYINRVNQLIISITSEDGSEEDIVIELTKQLSSQKEIDLLKFSDGISDYDVTRSGNKFIIENVIPSGTNQLNLNASLLDNNSEYSKSVTHKFIYLINNNVISNDGVINFDSSTYGRPITLRVIAEDGSQLDYVIEYNLDYTTSDKLANLFVGEFGNINEIVFEKNQNDYFINLNKNSPIDLYIRAYSEVDLLNRNLNKIYFSINFSKMMEMDRVNLEVSYGTMLIVQIYVQSEYNYENNINEFNIYTITIQREQNDEANIEFLSINDQEVFLSDHMEYLITNDDITSAFLKLEISLYAKLEILFISYVDFDTEEVFNYNIFINEINGVYLINLNRGGTYKVKFIVTSQDNNNLNEYTLDIKKEPSIDSMFHKLIIDGNELTIDLFEFNEITNTYSLIEPINKLYENSTITLIGNLYKYAFYIIDNDNNNIYFNLDEVILGLNTGINLFQIVVYAEDYNYQTIYHLEIIREYNPNTLYNVEHYKQNFDGSYYLEENEQLFAIALETIRANIKNYPGFTFNQFVNGTILEGVIAEDGSLVLKVFYQRNNYELVIIGNDEMGNVIGEGGIIKYDYNLFIKAIPLAGYNFIGWFENGVLISSEQSYAFKMPNRNLVLHAEFQLADYSINYNLDGGVNNKNNPNNYSINDLNIKLFEPQKDGYRFGGWYLSSDFIGYSIEEITIDMLGDITLYARWIERNKANYKVEHYIEDLNGNYVIYFIENFTEFVYMNVVSSPKNFSGFTYLKNISIPSGIVEGDDSLTLRLYYSRNEYNFNLINDTPNFGSIVGEVGVYKFDEEITVQANPNIGYEFIGWFNFDEFVSDLLEYTFTIPASDLELIAVFRIVSYEINYLLDGASNDPNNLEKYTISDLPFVLSEPTKVGYTFIGWYLSDDFTSEKIIEISLELLGDITLYSKWQINEYSINYYIDNGLIDTVILNYGEKAVKPNYQKLGYIFNGWYLDSTLNNVWDFNSLVDSDLSLYASFDLIEYSITYLLNDGQYEDSKTNPSFYNINSDTIVLNPLFKLGYTFIGWFDDNGKMITTIFAGSTGDLVLNAVFEINKYTINLLIIGRGFVDASGYTIIDGKIVVDYGAKVEINVSADDGFELISIKINESILEDISNYIFNFVDKDYEVEIIFEGTEPDILTLVDGAGFGDKLYIINRDNEVNLLLNYYLGQTVRDIKSNFINSPNRIKIFNKNDDELSDKDVLGTGYIIKLYNLDGTIVLDEVYIVLTGDTNGDCVINTNDLNDILRHIKLASPITVLPYLVAADPLNLGIVNTNAVTAILRHIKFLESLYN